MPALALDTVRSSSSAPNCMINATSPAAKSSPVKTAAISARDTRTSALMSKAVTSPITASIMIGSPHRIIAIQAASKGRGNKSKILITKEIPPSAKHVMSFGVPPHSRILSIFSTIFPMGTPPFIPMGVWVYYTYRGICLSISYPAPGLAGG